MAYAPGRQRTQSALDRLTPQRAYVEREPPLRRALSVGGVHPEAQPYKGTFSGGNVRPRVLKQNEQFYRYHGGEWANGQTVAPQGRWFTPDRYTGGADALNRLALPCTAPTRRTTVMVPAGTLVWEGSAAPLTHHSVAEGGGSRVVGGIGGGQQTFIPRSRLSAVTFQESVELGR